MNRDIDRYLIHRHGKIPFSYRLRDIVITLLAWVLWGWLCWDIIHLFHQELLYRITGNPEGETIGWVETFDELKVSFESSAAIIIVLFLFGLFNFSRIGRNAAVQSHPIEPLPVEQQVLAYGCRQEDVVVWQKCRIIEFAISDDGVIEKARKME